MAKSRNLYTRGLQKKLGGAVWYQAKGETRVRELAAHVSNPQSDSQMEQRVKLSNLVAIYRANKAWMDKYSFESKKASWSDYNAFVSANLKNNTIYLTKESVAVGAAVVAPYILTKGTLPSVGLSWIVGNEVFKTDLYTGDLSIPSGDTLVTIAQLSAALINNNNGLKEGDQISFIQNIQRTGANGDPFITLRYNEIVLDTTDTTTIADRIGADVLLTDEYEGMTCLCMAPADDSAVVGGLVCISRNEGSKIKVSSQTMVVSDETFATAFKNMRRAIRSYASGATEPFLVPGYNGGTNNAQMSISILGASLENGEMKTSTEVLPVNQNFSYEVYLSAPLQVDAVPSTGRLTYRLENGSNNIKDADIEIMEDRSKLLMTVTGDTTDIENALCCVNISFKVYDQDYSIGFVPNQGDVGE